MDTTTPNYLMFSDVHLGADLVQHTRPWTVSKLREVLKLDRRLAGMLDHYRQNADPGRPWRLVVAGDLVDFIGMSIAPAKNSSLDRPLTEDEQDYGIGSAADRVVHKMRAVSRRHSLVFEKLAAFVADGHSIVLVRGNHDVEFYFEPAQEAFIQALLERADLPNAEAEQQFRARIEFRHWFYYREGLLYVEHGHQYDATCSYQHQLAPVSPDDHSQIQYNFSDILLRYVARPTRGLSAEGHENRTMFDYIQLGVAMGLKGCFMLTMRFLGAIVRMFRLCLNNVGEAAARVKAEHERRLELLSERVKLRKDKLHALASFAAAPITLDLWDITRGVFLDGMIAMFLSLVTLAVLSFTIPLAYVPGVACALFVGIYLWKRSSKVIDPRAALKQGARQVARLLPTRFVIMGHTHEPGMESLGQGATYVNLGAWADDELGEEQQEPPCTHLVIRHVEGVAQARLMAWKGDQAAPLESQEEAA